VLNCTEGTINRYIRENNEELTKYGALVVLHRVTCIPFGELVEKIPNKPPGRDFIWPFDNRYSEF
jgi:hypothetical protein